MEQLRRIVRSELKRTRTTLLAGVVLLVLLVVLVGWTTDYRSCARQSPIRQAAHLDAQVARSSAYYWATHEHPEIAALAAKRARILESERPLHCFSVLPGA